MPGACDDGCICLHCGMDYHSASIEAGADMQAARILELEDRIKIVRGEERVRCLAIAWGTLKEYSGGNRGEMLKAYKHGIQTVINALGALPDSFAVRTLAAVGGAAKQRERLGFPELSDDEKATNLALNMAAAKEEK